MANAVNRLRIELEETTCLPIIIPTHFEAVIDVSLCKGSLHFCEILRLHHLDGYFEMKRFE